MSETNNVDTTVTKEEINIDELFGAGADNVTLPEDTKPKMMDPIRPEVDMTFDQPVEKEDWMDEEGFVPPESVTKDTKEGIKVKGDSIIDAIDVDPEVSVTVIEFNSNNKSVMEVSLGSENLSAGSLSFLVYP